MLSGIEDAAAAVAPDVSWPQVDSSRVALYASVGPTLTHYDVDVLGAELNRRTLERWMRAGVTAVFRCFLISVRMCDDAAQK